MNIQTQIARLNALAKITEDMDIDDDAFPVLCELRQEIKESLKDHLCPHSLDLRTDHGDHGRCGCGEFVDTFDTKYLSCGGDWLWGDVMYAHVPNKEDE